MTQLKDIEGLVFSGFLPRRTKITARMTKDKVGKSLSLADEKEGIMIEIPLEPIEKELREIVRG